MSVRLLGIKNEFHLLQISPSGGTSPDHLLHSTKLCFTEDQSQMLIFIILSFLDHLSLGKKIIIVKLIQNSPFLCLLSISQHIFPHLLQQKLGVIFFSNRSNPLLLPGVFVFWKCSDAKNFRVYRSVA